MEIIFCKNGCLYRAYLNALLELQNQRKPPVPGVLDRKWEHCWLIPLPGKVKAAVRTPSRTKETKAEAERTLTPLV